MEELKLIYIVDIGTDWTESNLYEFLFSNTTQNIDGNGWDITPAAGNPEPPHKHFVKAVGKLTTELKFDTIQNSDTFSLYDALDGVIALGWENISDYETYPDKRICFKFGDSIERVKELLYSKDIILEVKEVKNGPKKNN
jgi:hypothetical protein